jgi:hypothetical protein
MTTIRCKEKIRNERRMRKRWSNNKTILPPLVENLDRPGEMIRKTTQNGVTTIKYNDKAHGGLPVTFIIGRRKKKRDEMPERINPTSRPWGLNNSIKVAAAIRSATDPRD